jgi:hypothetical protein
VQERLAGNGAREESGAPSNLGQQGEFHLILLGNYDDNADTTDATFSACSQTNQTSTHKKDRVRTTAASAPVETNKFDDCGSMTGR